MGDNGIEVDGLVRDFKGGVRAVDGIELRVAPVENTMPQCSHLMRISVPEAFGIAEKTICGSWWRAQDDLAAACTRLGACLCGLRARGAAQCSLVAPETWDRPWT